VDLIDSGTHLGNLAGSARLFLKLVVSLVRRFFVAKRVGLFLVDGFFFQGSGSGKEGSFRPAILRRGAVGRLGNAHHFIVFLNQFLAWGSGFAYGGCSTGAAWRGLLKFAIPVY